MTVMLGSAACWDGRVRIPAGIIATRSNGSPPSPQHLPAPGSRALDNVMCVTVFVTRVKDLSSGWPGHSATADYHTGPSSTTVA